MEDQKTALIDEKDHVVRFSLSSITTTNSSSSGNEQHRSSDGEINTNTKQNSETSNQTNITSPIECEQSKESRKIVENEDRSELDKDTSTKPQSPNPSDTNNNSVLLQQNQQQSSSMSSNALTMSASKLTQQLAPVSVNTKDTLNNNRDSSTLKAVGEGVVVSVISSGSSSMVSSCSLSSGSGGSSNEPTMTNSQISPNAYKSINSSLLSNVSEDSSSPSGGLLSSLEGTNQKSFSSSGESNKSSTPLQSSTPQMKKSGGESVSSTTPTLISSSTSSSTSSQQTVLSSNKKKTPNSGSKSSKKPWYSAFVNTYKQKNEDFRRLFKLPPEEHLLVDYSAAMQREILAHGRLYVSLNYVCFRANIIGWETTIIIKFKDIRSIYKDKTAKIIPNAISIVLDNEKYFFTSFISRDKTYATLFRIWQMALSDSLMSNEEIDTILKSCYGEDLGYNSDDAEYEYYSKLKDKSNNQETMDIADYSIHQSLSFIEPNRMSAQNANNAVGNHETSSAKEMIFSDTEIGAKPTNSAVRFDTSSFSDDQSNVTNRQQAHTSPKRKNTNHQIHSSSSSGSSFSPYVPPSATAAVGHTSLINQNFAHQHNSHHPGHRQSSSFDTAMIDTSENFNQADGERPRSMVGSQLQTQKFTHQHKANKKRAPMHPAQQLNSIPSNSSNAVDLKVDPVDLINAQNEANNGEENKSTEVTSSAVTNVESQATGREQNGTTNQERSDSSSSVEFDANDSDVPSALTHTPLHNVKCSCGEHPGKEMLNQVYAVTVNYLWECLFGHTTFCRNYWESRKFGNIKVGEWKLVNNYPFRQLEFTVDLGGAIGRPKNTEEQKILEYRPNECIVLESESFTHGVPYSDCFTTRNRFCLTRVNSTSTRLCIYSFLNFVQKPNFIAKSFIERNTMGALRDSYNYLASLIANEYINGDSASCHESDANLKRLIYSSSAITAHPNRLPHKSMSASALLSTSKQQPQRRPKPDTTTTNTLLITAASNSVGESCSIFERTREFDENGNMLEEELSAQQFSREKTIPSISVPANNRLPAHISAITDETSGALKHSQLKSAKMPNLIEQEATNRSGSPGSGGMNTKQQSTSTINSSASSNKHHPHNHHNHHNQQHPTASSGGDMAQKPHLQQKVPANGSPSNRAPKKKPPSSSPQETASLDDVDLVSPADFRQSVPPNVSSPICPPNNSPPLTQLVPIQKFSFFKWEVNVDTLVRLFIVAMICLMVINAMLYYKLRRIESLADSLRNDPSLMTRVNMADRQFESVLIEAQSSNTNLERESNDWRNLISKTLDAIEKMENSLRQWDKTLESREKQPLSSTLTAANTAPKRDL